PARVREGLDLLLRPRRIAADALRQVEARGAIAQIEQDVPQCQAVLAAGDRDQHALLGRAHALCRDRPLDLPAEKDEVTRPAKAGVVRPQVDLGLRATAGARHVPPPEMTARTSTSSSSSTISPSRSRRSPRITMTVPGSTPSSARRRPTERRPVNSRVRPCGCRCTRMGIGGRVARCPDRLKPRRRFLTPLRSTRIQTRLRPHRDAADEMAEKKAKTAEKGGDSVRKQICPTYATEVRVVQYAGAGRRGS